MGDNTNLLVVGHDMDNFGAIPLLDSRTKLPILLGTAILSSLPLEIDVCQTILL
jgi:hypothetical protein